MKNKTFLSRRRLSLFRAAEGLLPPDSVLCPEPPAHRRSYGRELSNLISTAEEGKGVSSVQALFAHGLMLRLLLAGCILGLLLLVPLFSLGEPLPLGSDLSGSMSIPLREEIDSPVYSYSFSYPHIEGDDPSAELINRFYQDTADIALDFDVPMMADFYSGEETDRDIIIRITYEVTCNNDDYFSVLLRTEGTDYTTWAGNTFARHNTKAGSSVALPYLLGILSNDESDSWLQDRQTAKADRLVRNLVWDTLQSRRDQLKVWPDYDRDLFDLTFYPEEDFYLDKTGNPVFYLQPGSAADAESGLLLFPISLMDILDEL